MSKVKTTIEDYLVLLFEKKPELVGVPRQEVLDALNQEFSTKFSYRHLSLVYEPIVDFEIIEEEIEEDFYDGY